MLATAMPARRRLPTLFSIYQPLEEYWTTCGTSLESGLDLERALPPLDAFLIHLLLERLPNISALIDLAADRTGGASCVLGLLHPRVPTVVAGVWPSTASSVQMLASLEEFRRRQGLSATLETQSATTLLASPSWPRGTVILLDARTLDPERLANLMTRWCDPQAEVVIFLLGLGAVGACPALDAVLRGCPAGGACRFWLARELEEALSASRLGIVAPTGPAGAAAALGHVQQLFATNCSFLHLLRDANQRALEAAQLDADIMASHPSAWPLQRELEEWKRHAHEAREQAELVRRQLNEAAQQRMALQQNLEAIQRSLAYRLARRLSRCRGWLAARCRLLG